MMAVDLSKAASVVTAATRRIEEVLVRLSSNRLHLLTLCLVSSAILSEMLGQDMNWDLKNYHLYNPYALLEGRWGIDLAPALQTYFNPLADIPYYLLATKVLAGFPRLMAALQGLYYGVLIFFVFLINREAFRDRSNFPAITAFLATLIGISAAGVISEVGTTFNDVQGAACILGGAYLLIPRSDAADDSDRRRILLAGVAFGLGAAVKLTFGYYAVAAIAAIAASRGSLRATARTTLLFCIGCGVCALVLAGPWCLWVYHLTGNPIYPVFNALFQSEWYPPREYIPATNAGGSLKPFLTMLLLPFTWARYNYMVITEVGFRDARFAAALVAGFLMAAIMLVALAARKRVRDDVVDALPLSGPLRFVIAFAVSSYVVWLVGFMVLRYGFPPEVLTGTMIVATLQVIVAALLRPAVRSAATLALTVVIGVSLAATTIYPTWGRLPFYGRRIYSVDIPAFPPNSMITLMGVPMSYLVPFFKSKDFIAVGISAATGEARQYRLFAETRNRITGHSGPIFVITDDNSHHYRGIAADAGVTWRDESCIPLKVNIDMNKLHWCVGEIKRSP